MKMVITAAARSPRLLPLTKNTPVSLLEVGGKPILAHQFEAIKYAGINDTLVITGFCAEQIEEFSAGKATCVYNPFFESCNVAMNLWTIRQELESGFILQYSDTLFQPDLVKEVATAEGDILLVVDRRGVDKEAEKVTLQQGVVTDIGKVVEEPYGEYTGIAKFSSNMIPVLIEELEQIARNNINTGFPDLIKRLIGKGNKVSVHTTDYPWMDIDFADDLEKAREMWA